MVNRERFMLDVDSEGFPLVDTQAASFNLTTERKHTAESAMMLADHKCMRCANPLGWQEVDGVVLPRITWADEHYEPRTTTEERKAVAEMLLQGRAL